jgi:hypothetical protein
LRVPADRELKTGFLGRWNPYDPDHDGFMEIKRAARVSFSYHKVGLSGRSRP